MSAASLEEPCDEPDQESESVSQIALRLLIALSGALLVGIALLIWLFMRRRRGKAVFFSTSPRQAPSAEQGKPAGWVISLITSIVASFLSGILLFIIAPYFASSPPDMGPRPAILESPEVVVSDATSIEAPGTPSPMIPSQELSAEREDATQSELSSITAGADESGSELQEAAGSAAPQDQPGPTGLDEQDAVEDSIESDEATLREQGTSDGLLFFDGFALRQNARWVAVSGTWTVINDRFTPIETEPGAPYTATVDLERLDRYVVETEVHLGSLIAFRGCEAMAYVLARRSRSGGSGHDVGVHLSGRVVASLGGPAQWEYKLTTYTSAYDVDTLSFTSGAAVGIRIRVEGSLYTIYRDGEQVCQFNDPLYDAEESSAVGLTVLNPSGWTLSPCGTPKTPTSFDNFRVSVAP